jgi:tRNA(fMet)-specific endonuclease VapC
MMMAGKYILDSNVVVPFLNGDPELKEKFARHEELYIPIIVLGELYYEALNSSKKESNLEKIEGFKEEIYLLDSDEFTARVYGEVKKG